MQRRQWPRIELSRLIVGPLSEDSNLLLRIIGLHGRDLLSLLG
jgi:hypothetical protein